MYYVPDFERELLRNDAVLQKVGDPRVLCVVHEFVSSKTGQLFRIDGFCSVASAVNCCGFHPICAYGQRSSHGCDCGLDFARYVCDTNAGEHTVKQTTQDTVVRTQNSHQNA